MTNQNKAHAVNVGSVYKPNGKSGLNSVAIDGTIINHFGTNATGNSIHAMGVARIGYNQTSLKPMQYPRTESVFFHALNNGVLFAPVQANCHTSTGDAVSGNAPTVIGSRTSLTLTGGTKSLNPMEGIMPKKSTVAIATSQTTTENYSSNNNQFGTDTDMVQPTPYANKEDYIACAPLFAVYVYLDGGTNDDGITQGLPRLVAYCTDKDEAKRKGLNALTNTENAITCDIKDLSGKPWALKMEGVDNQGWVSGMTFYLPTEQDALDYARELFDSQRYGLEFKEAWIKNLKLDFYCGVAQPVKHRLENYITNGEYRKGGAL